MHTCNSLLIKFRDTGFPASTVIPCHLLTSVPGVSQPPLSLHCSPASEPKISMKAWFASRRIRTSREKPKGVHNTSKKRTRDVRG